LTWNYYRKGGYSIGSEDYRWEVLRKYINPFLFVLFDAIFIALIQNLLLVSITTPTYVLLLTSTIKGQEYGTVDIITGAMIVAILAVEYTADQQQWDFHKAKDIYKKSARITGGFTQADLDRGFLTHGLWAWSRHPNFAAEQGMFSHTFTTNDLAVWLTLYQWSTSVTMTAWNWTVVGALAYLALFQASTWFTEFITAKKYPQYKEFQEKVGMFVPKLNTGTLSDPTASDMPAKTPAKKARKAA
jgi:steroid 5-alpha reductase family enzyme